MVTSRRSLPFSEMLPPAPAARVRVSPYPAAEHCLPARGTGGATASPVAGPRHEEATSARAALGPWPSDSDDAPEHIGAALAARSSDAPVRRHGATPSPDRARGAAPERRRHADGPPRRRPNPATDRSPRPASGG